MCKPECVCGYEMHPRIKKKKKKRLTNDAAWPLWCISLSVNWFYLWSLLHWSLLCTWFSFSKHEVVILNSLGNHLLYDTYLQTILHIFMLRVHRRYNENQEARSSCGVCVCVCDRSMADHAAEHVLTALVWRCTAAPYWIISQSHHCSTYYYKQSLIILHTL